MRGFGRVAGGIVMAFVMAGCSTAPASSPPRSFAATPPPTAASPRPTVTASPSPSLAPTPAPPASVPASRAALESWLPPLDPGVTPAFRVNDFVASIVDRTPVSPTPGAPPYRFYTGDPDPATHPIEGVAKAGTLIVVHGPVVVDRVQWYLLTPAQLVIDVPTGWAPIASPDGKPWLGPASVPCPQSPLGADALEPLSLTDGLPGCYGSDEVTISGNLACDPAPDAFVVGPAWLAGGKCNLAGTHVTIYGLDTNLPPGHYAVTGHFDDPSAGSCRDGLGGTSDADNLAAFLHCRRGLVATGVAALR